MNGKLPYSRETFIGAETEKDFRGMLWDMFAHDAHCTQKRIAACSKRFEELEERDDDIDRRVTKTNKRVTETNKAITNRKYFDTGISAASGAMSGFLTALAMAKKFFMGGP